MQMQLESGMQLSWVTLGHTFSCEQVSLHPQQRRVYAASIYHFSSIKLLNHYCYSFQLNLY